MKRFMTKKVAAVALTAGLLVGTGGVAVAYFTSGGSGSGTANVGSPGATDFVITSTWNDGSAIYPGQGGVEYSATAKNTGSGSEYIGSVPVTIDNNGTDVINSEGQAVSGCDYTWFNAPNLAFNTQVNSGATTDPVTGTVSMTESETDQSACQGVTLKLIFGTPD